jgi:hypothetical protein
MTTINNDIRVDPLLSDYIMAADEYFSPGSGAAEKRRYFEAVELLEKLLPEKLAEFGECLDLMVSTLEEDGIYGEDGIGEVRDDFGSRFGSVIQQAIFYNGLEGDGIF